MPITLSELAKVAGVSVSTVSRALNDSDHKVNEETRQYIQNLAKELGYRPNMMARGLKTDRTFTIGIIVDNIVSPFSPLIIRGIQDHLKNHNYFSVIINADWDPEAETEAVHQLISRSIDGIIFVESWLRGANPTLDLANKPYVFVHRLSSGVFNNLVLASLAHYLATYDAQGVQIHQCASSELASELATRQHVGLRITTEFPWQGQIELEVTKTDDSAWKLSLRVPDWSQHPKLSVNGQVIDAPPMRKGYIVIERNWLVGDVIELDLMMEPVLITSNPRRWLTSEDLLDAAASTRMVDP